MRMRLEQDSRDTQLSLQEAQHQIDIISKDLRRYKILDKKFLIAKSELERQADRLINWKLRVIYYKNTIVGTKIIPFSI